MTIDYDDDDDEHFFKKQKLCKSFSASNVARVEDVQVHGVAIRAVWLFSVGEARHIVSVVAVGWTLELQVLGASSHHLVTNATTRLDNILLRARVCRGAPGERGCAHPLLVRVRAVVARPVLNVAAVVQREHSAKRHEGQIARFRRNSAYASRTLSA